MSRRAATGADTGAGLKTIGAIVFVLVMALVVVVLVNARPAPDPFDPRSGRPDGTRGLVLTLRDAGASVTIGRDLDGIGGDVRVVVLDDRLDDDQRSDLLDRVEAGGVAVVADPESTLHGGSGLDGGAVAIDTGALDPDRQLEWDLEANLLPGRCTIAALADVRGLVVPDGVLFPVGPDEPACFTESGRSDGDGQAFAIVREIGDGLVVGLGDNEPFQNRWLRGADNAALMVALLAPEPGSEVVVLLGTDANRTIQDVGSGDETLGDLVPTWAWMAMILGAIGFVVFAASRATRLGRVLQEPVATPVDGNELVVATGNLMERSGQAPTAAWLLLHRLHRDLCVGHGVPLDAPLDDLDRVVAASGAVPRGEVERLLRSTAATDHQLVEVARAVHRLRDLVATPITDRGSDAASDPPTDSPMPLHAEEAPTP